VSAGWVRLTMSSEVANRARYRALLQTEFPHLLV
jgi:hypothetical protein